MGFFSSPPKKIKRDDFNKSLKEIKELSDKERSYVEGVFQKPLKDGISKAELKSEIKGLERNTGDQLDSIEVKRLKEKLEKKF